MRKRPNQGRGLRAFRAKTEASLKRLERRYPELATYDFVLGYLHRRTGYKTIRELRRNN